MPAIFDETTGNVEVTCDICGERITHSNEWGMFCDNECGLEESKAAKDEVMKMIDGFSKMFGDDDRNL
jgi:hypothetical protein